MASLAIRPFSSRQGGMFSKTDPKKSKAKGKPGEVVAKPAPPSIVSADLRMVGDLQSEGEIHVDGSIDGDIRSTHLLVGETARIKGEIVADSVVVHGTVIGQIKAKTVTLSHTAQVTGGILHENLAIEKGAFLEGHCKRMDSPKATSGRINLIVKDKPDDDASLPTGMVGAPPKVATPT
jgi:cytoskeletal protein CcmA (bactofilin family)